MLGPRWANVEPTGSTLGQRGANEIGCLGTYAQQNQAKPEPNTKQILVPDSI